MTFELTHVALICLGYLLLIFGIATITERGWLPKRLTEHPLTYILSLGIFASAWAFYGVIDLAFQFGYGALAYYLGTGALFLFAPVALEPITELARRHQVHSLADLLVFRYHSHGIGALTTLCMLLGILPLMALQIQAIADTMHILTVSRDPAIPLVGTGLTFKDLMALTYCGILALFTVLFGSNRERHRGLITAMAFESLLKVFALCAIGLVAVYGVFDGFSGLDQWLERNPENLALLHSPIRDGASHTLLLVFVATAVTMPHIFHMGVAENPILRNTRTVTWAFPLFLLFLALPIFPILWAGFELSVPLPAQYFTLGVPILTESPSLTVLAFIGGLSASTGAMVVITLALSTMVMNHWLLPFLRLRRRQDIYSQLVWLRRAVIAALFVGSYFFYWMLDNRQSLFHLALVAFIETLQFVPGIFAIVFWARGNRRGVIAGLTAGTLVWMVGLLIPLLTGLEQISVPFGDGSLSVGISRWSEITVISLGLNTLIFIGVSLLTRQTEEEAYSAELCAADELSHPVRQALDVHSASEFKTRLSKPLGKVTASREVDLALRQLGLRVSERRPYALRRLRDQLEANLSGLMGIHVAGEIMDNHLPYKLAEARDTVDINLIENRLSQYRSHLTGLSAELNNLRLYHRKTLQELPMAVCSLGRDKEILMWNRAMEKLTGIAADDILGSHLDNLVEPWCELLGNFSGGEDAHLYRHEITLNNRPHWISLHKAAIEGPISGRRGSTASQEDQVILLEDVTETQLLEQELIHSERLASVGRLAAGVAHEIGNPITGIACLCQNLRYESENPDVLETAEQILSQTDRVTRIVHSLVSYSHSGRNKKSAYEAVALRDCAAEAIALLSLQKDKTEVFFDNDIAPNAIVAGDLQQLIQVFINLLSNARDASEPKGRVMLASDEDDNDITLTVTDEGEGIDPEYLDQILEPFFTTKDPGEGTGLGLAMVYSIIDDHGGNLDIISPANPSTQRGAQIVIKLPRHLDSVITHTVSDAPEKAD
ncbi:ATP-binding protein [Gilvimarinus xylanilyticus]|uniref:histidine kinase n=1 Tax=Gilvimarinus xylanilyticus TaxID=2944139 RepID=A0A9X2HY52_9GAMM|nr:ATP-binding protein [Gilvimarinus xylanilyticus]MCP8899244.1 ATP-binding protein [Gilvimarinus xylanilyticus]